MVEKVGFPGYAVVRGFFSAGEISSLETVLKAIHPVTFPDVGTCPDAVNKHSALWPWVAHPRLLDEVRRLLGTVKPRFLRHSDVHANFVAAKWHRDSACRSSECEGEDWDESSEPYRILRCGIYTTGADFQVIPFSHVKPGLSEDRGIVLRLERGDLIAFDPRIYHRGSPITDEKFSVFFSYGDENAHSRRFSDYYLQVRQDLGYQDYGPEVRVFLEGCGLNIS